MPGVYIQSNTWAAAQPGQTVPNTGWHSHPGHSLIIVTSGTLTDYEADDPTCTPHVTLPRGSRRMKFQKGSSLVLLRGEIQHKDLWLIDLDTGTERQLTNLAPDFNISDFDISADGSEAILEREQERSSVVMMDLPQR